MTPMATPEPDGSRRFTDLTALTAEQLERRQRNVDAAFRTTLIATVDGRVLTGLERPQQGKTRHFADAEGKPFTLQEDEIEETKITNLSLMPANVTETLTEEQILDLMAYLLSQSSEK
jgi:putative heme-binding domain-containing protein